MRTNTTGRTGQIVIARPADDGGIAVGREVDAGALNGVPDRSRTDQFGLFDPAVPDALVDPGCAFASVIPDAPDDGGVPVG
jgi:hypothetical protein